MAVYEHRPDVRHDDNPLPWRVAASLCVPRFYSRRLLVHAQGLHGFLHVRDGEGNGAALSL